MTDASTLKSVLSDPELILSTRAGDSDAFAELYRRHVGSAHAAAASLTRSRADRDDIVAEAFSRVLSVLQRGGGPDVSFRPYLLTSLRNAFYDKIKRDRREEPTDDTEDSVNLSLLDSTASADDRAIVARAFASLPERWQLVLWHTEVEGRSPAEVSPLLGIAPNAAAALAYRAREGLRAAYLQEHLQQPLDLSCRECASNLGSYVRDGLSSRERTRVDSHLQTCAACTALLLELQDADVHLRAVLIPLIVGVPAAKYLAALHGGSGLASQVHRLRQSASRNPIVAGVISAVLLVALVIAAIALVGGDPSPGGLAAGGTEASIDITPTSPSSAVSTDSRTDTSQPASRDASTATSPSSDTVEATPSNTTSTNTQPSTPVVIPTGTLPANTIPNSTRPRTTTPTTTRLTNPNTTRPTTPTSPAATPATTPATVPATTPTTTPTTAAATTSTLPTTTSTTVPPPSPPQLAIGTEVVQPGIAGGRALVRINLANGTTVGGGAARRLDSGPAANVHVSIALPSGITFSTVNDPAWKCSVSTSAVLDCAISSLGSATRDSADLTLSLAPGATAFQISPSVSADGAKPVESASGSLSVPVQTIPGLLWADYDTGSVLTVGNSSMTCDTVDPNCAAARAANTKVSLNRQSYNMVFVDSQVGPDADLHDPFNSSTASLSLGAASVNRAYLVWGGDTDGPSVDAPNALRSDVVRLKAADGSLHDLVATDVATYGSGQYTANIDVTAIVAAAGSGTYQVDDIQAAQHLGSFAGWQLIVVAHDAAAPMRLLTVISPNATIAARSPANVTVSLGAHTGNRPVSLAIASYEGDLGLNTERLTINGVQVSNAASPVDNPFNSSRAGAVDRNDVNGFGVDADLFVTQITGTTLSIDPTSTGDLVRLAMFAIAIDL